MQTEQKAQRPPHDGSPGSAPGRGRVGAGSVRSDLRRRQHLHRAWIGHPYRPNAASVAINRAAVVPGVYGEDKRRVVAPEALGAVRPEAIVHAEEQLDLSAWYCFRPLSPKRSRSTSETLQNHFGCKMRAMCLAQAHPPEGQICSFRLGNQHFPKVDVWHSWPLLNGLCICFRRLLAFHGLLDGLLVEFCCLPGRPDP